MRRKRKNSRRSMNNKSMKMKRKKAKVQFAAEGRIREKRRDPRVEEGRRNRVGGGGGGGGKNNKEIGLGFGGNY